MVISYKALGKVYLKREDYDKAEKFFMKCLKIATRASLKISSDVSKKLGNLYLQKNAYSHHE
jgi:uncharacterized protein HemY